MLGLTDHFDILLFGIPCIIIALIAWRTHPVHTLFGAMFIDLTVQLLRSITTQGTANIPLHQVAGAIAMGMAAGLVTRIMQRRRPGRRPIRPVLPPQPAAGPRAGQLLRQGASRPR